MNWARTEAELVMFRAVADLLAKTGLHPRQVDVLGERRRRGWAAAAGSWWLREGVAAWVPQCCSRGAHLRACLPACLFRRHCYHSPAPTQPRPSLPPPPPQSPTAPCSAPRPPWPP